METVSRRPPAPSAAERARTIAARGGRAVLMPATDGETVRLEPILHHIHRNGTTSLLLPDDHPLVAMAWQAPHGELTAMLELADPAPVKLREPVRGLLWITGWLQAMDEDGARADALCVAEHRPDPRLLDVGHGATMLRMEPASLVLADAEGTCSLRLAEFADATPDPFCLMEDDWLRHLEVSHRDVVSLLARHLPEDLRGGHVRPLGLDRLGLRLRVEAPGGDHDIRLAFSRPVSTPAELSRELRLLVGCPFLASVHLD